MADVGRVLVVSCSSFLSPEDIINGEKIYSLKTKKIFCPVWGNSVVIFGGQV